MMLKLPLFVHKDLAGKMPSWWQSSEAKLGGT